MSPLKLLTRAMLVIALMMGVLTLSAPPAAAESSGPICEQGVLTADGQCETDIGPAGDTCPALEEDGECYQLVPAVEACEAGTLIDGACRVSVPDTVELSCLPPSEPADDDGISCLTIVPADESLGCVNGDLIDGQCLEFIASAVQEETCPNDEDVLGCYRNILAEFYCPVGFPVDGNVCLVDVPPIEGDPACPIELDLVVLSGELRCGFLFGGDFECGVTQYGIPEYIGDGLCRDALFSIGCDIYFEEFSEFYDFIEEDAGGCYGIDFEAPFPCIAPYTPIFEGEVCAVLLGPPNACPDGYEFDGEECVLIFDAQIECDGIFLGFDDGGDPVCFQDVGPAEVSLTCPDGSDGTEGCLAVIAGDYRCEVGELTENNECRIAEEPLLSDPFCPIGLLVDGGCYDDFGTPVTIYSCPVGDLVGNACFVLSGAVETATCGEALGAPGDCYILDSATVTCPDGAAPGAEFPTSCREPVDRVGGGCPDGATELDGRCVEYSDPVWFCNNELVTINMVLGDSGIGTAANDVILGTPDNDIIQGRNGNDTICGGGGNDRISGNAGNDEIFGEAGEDVLIGGNNDDYVDGGEGNDRLFGSAGDDQLWGSYGDDSLYGSSGDDILRGGRGDDDLFGRSGNDILRGGLGNDDLNGGPDTDRCSGGPGAGTVIACEPAAVG